MHADPTGRSHWIFDLDGTLTVPVHDFDGIRRELGLPPGLPILEQLALLPADEAEPLHRRLEQIELELARSARAWPGVEGLLGALAGRGATLGILTRNLRSLAEITLNEVGLGGFFLPGHILGRNEAAPKPSPEGVELLLRRWQATPEDAVMVGDYLFDLQAGRAAGTATVLVDSDGSRPWRHLADRVVRELDTGLLEASDG